MVLITSSLFEQTMFYIYILHSQLNNKYYIGSTQNTEERLIRHNSGRSKATKTGIPWIIVYTETYSSRSEALKREYQIKSWKSRVMIEKLIDKHK